jgi:EAL domain-containing protein (putative c-di-GMP-specific phosphodiesterase class I)
VVVLKPIVDLRTGVLVAVEALSRFQAQTPLEAFERARTSGTGPELEAAAIRAALLAGPSVWPSR